MCASVSEEPESPIHQIAFTHFIACMNADTHVVAIHLCAVNEPRSSRPAEKQPLKSWVLCRLSTAGLLLVLSLLYPRWYMACVLTLMLDILSHWMHMYATLVTGSDTHKVSCTRGLFHSPACAPHARRNPGKSTPHNAVLLETRLPAGAGRAQPQSCGQGVLQEPGVHGHLLHMLRGPVPRALPAALAARPVGLVMCAPVLPIFLHCL